MGETKIIYHIDDEDTPYLIKLPVPADRVTLGDFKNALNRPNYKFFFKSMDDDFGVVKEEIIDEDTHLPCFNGRVVSWLVPAESSASDTQSQPDVQIPTERVGGIGDSRPPSFHASTSVASQDEPCDTCTEESESVLGAAAGRAPPRLNGQSKLDRPPRPDRGHYDASAMMNSDMETTSFLDSEDDTRLSTVTDTATSMASKYGRHRRRRRRHRPPPMSRVGINKASSFSSITDSTMSLNIITITLNMDTVNFLGISIVGQSNKGGDGGIYVGSIMKGGAVAQDGRVEPGDMILEVNGISFENMSNDDAVKALREAVHKPGPITLVVAKCWDPNPKGYFTVPRQEPVRPIDPSAWVAHTTALRDQFAGRGPGGGGGGASAAPSLSVVTSTTSSSVTASSATELERIDDLNLTVNTDMGSVVKAMAHPESGLEIRDRMWLKITIPSAFIGADMVDWLFSHVEGFADRRDARKYACNLLKSGYIRHTVNKLTFSEQCYYIFGDYTGGPPVYPDLSAMSLEDVDSVSEADRDTLTPLPFPSNAATGTTTTTTTTSAISKNNSSNNQFSLPSSSFLPLVPPHPYAESSCYSALGVFREGATSSPVPPTQPPAYVGGGGGGGGHDSASSVHSVSVHNACSCVPVKWPACFAAERLLAKTVCNEDKEPNNNNNNSNNNGNSSSAKVSSAPVSSKVEDATPATAGAEGSSQSSSGKKDHQEKGDHKTTSPMESGSESEVTSVASARPTQAGTPGVAPGQPIPLGAIPAELSGSQQSFRMAMGNPCEFFVDVM